MPWPPGRRLRAEWADHQRPMGAARGCHGRRGPTPPAPFCARGANQIPHSTLKSSPNPNPPKRPAPRLHKHHHRRGAGARAHRRRRRRRRREAARVGGVPGRPRVWRAALPLAPPPLPFRGCAAAARVFGHEDVASLSHSPQIACRNVLLTSKSPQNESESIASPHHPSPHDRPDPQATCSSRRRRRFMN
jgi:hypothetical protein